MNHTILWVEDDADDAFLIGRAIKKAGLEQPMLVTDGGEAVAYLSGTGTFSDRSAHPIHSLILLDLKLPKMSGFEVLQWIRGNPELRRIPVIMFTSSKAETDIDRAYDLGANAYLLKSVDHEDLVEALKRLRDFWMDLNLNPSTPVHEVAATAPNLRFP
jgi:CheY-like chemotaxis protein